MNKLIATPSRTKEILEKYDLHAKKGFGQNFLVDPVIVERCAKEAHSEGAVIEIGPGIGSLTEAIRKKQRDLFVRQIELAKQLGKPIAVHSRDAMQDTFDIMKEHHCHGLLHCFSGTKEMAKEFTKLGYYIALGGALTFKNARHSVEVAETIDEKWLLTETDCPYMAPVPVRGTRNEPCNIPYITRKMAEVRNVSEEYMAEVILNNWERYLKCQ